MQGPGRVRWFVGPDPGRSRRDRSSSAPRSVHFRTEIGSLPHRDRFTSASRSVRWHETASGRVGRSGCAPRARGRTRSRGDGVVSTAVERARTRRAISREPAGNPALLFGVAGVMSRLARTAKEIEDEIGVWLAVLTRCLQLKDEHEILELDHVLRAAPDAFERHRIGLARASQERGERIAAAARTLITQMTEVGGAVKDFQGPLGTGSLLFAAP